MTKYEQIRDIITEDFNECRTCRERKGLRKFIGGGCIANAIINGVYSVNKCSCWKPSRKVLKQIGLL